MTNVISRRPVSMLTFVAVLFAYVMGASATDDWPQWRGPHRNDISSETGLLKTWPKSGPPKIWTNDQAGLGYAGFAIVNEQLFTMGLDGDQEFALCLNANDGTEIWRTKIGDRYQNGWGDGPRSTPSIDGDRAYFMSGNGELACLNKSNGERVWSVSMSDFGGKVPRWGYAESPLVDGDQVVCTPGGSVGTIVALNKETGKKIWQTKPIMGVGRDGKTPKSVDAHYSSLIPQDLNQRRQYVQLLVSAIVGIDAETGEVLWQSSWPGRTAVIPSPIVEEGNVYVTSGYGAGSKRLTMADNNTVSEQWYTKDMQNHHGSVIKVGDFYFGSSSRAFVCQAASDGKMKWNDRSIKKGALGYADGLFYHVQEDDGKVLLFEGDENSHQIKGSFVLSPQSKKRSSRGKIWVHPVIANGKLYLRDQEIIYCFDIKE